MIRVITVGLDCATWDLIKPWANAQKLPYFMRLIEGGTTANLKSTYPPVTPVAWPSLFTGKNPGKHSIFGFTDSDPLSLKIPCISDNYMKSKPIWDILSENGKKVCLVNIPFAFPPSKVNGIMTTGTRTPSISSEFTYPKELKNELLGKYDLIPDYGSEVYKDKETFCIAHDKGLEENLKMSLYLLRKDYWDFYTFIPVENSIDHVQDFFWDDMDLNHPLHNEKTSEKYKDKMIPSTNSNIVKCLIWVTILTLMRSRRILHLIRNANPENAHRYTHLRWAKVFTEQADRLLNEVLECMGLRRGMLTLYEIYLGQGCDPNVERERLMERWVT